MRFAVFSDIHADLNNLEKAFKKANSLSVSKIFHAGDLVGHGQNPNEVIKFLFSRRIKGVMGNFDEAVAFDLPSCGCFAKTKEDKKRVQKALQVAKELTTEDSKVKLRSLPDELRFTIKGKRILIIHATVFGIAQYLFENDEEEIFEDVVNDSQADVIICGHTHAPYHKIINGVHIINVGSVSYPRFESDSAGFSVIEIDKDIKQKFYVVK